VDRVSDLLGLVLDPPFEALICGKLSQFGTALLSSSPPPAVPRGGNGLDLPDLLLDPVDALGCSYEGFENRLQVGIFFPQLP
jgi:hypothetical protein